MKRYLSIFMLLSRSVFYKLLAVFFGTAALHTAVYFLLCDQRNIEAIYNHWGMKVMFGIGLVTTTAMLMDTLSQSGSKLDYTIRRLRIGSRSLCFCQSVFNIACFLMFWAVEICVALLLCRVWVNTMGVESHQVVYLAFYRSELLHSLLPLDDVSRWVRNFLCFTGLGFSVACAPIFQRSGRQYLGVLVLPIVLTFLFPAGIADLVNDGLLGLAAVVVPVAMSVTIWEEIIENED